MSARVCVGPPLLASGESIGSSGEARGAGLVGAIGGGQVKLPASATPTRLSAASMAVAVPGGAVDVGASRSAGVVATMVLFKVIVTAATFFLMPPPVPAVATLPVTVQLLRVKVAAVVIQMAPPPLPRWRYCRRACSW